MVGWGGEEGGDEGGGTGGGGTNWGKGGKHAGNSKPRVHRTENKHKESDIFGELRRGVATCTHVCTWKRL